MILESAFLQVRPGQSAAFESAFEEAQAIISSMPGYRSHELQRCIERKDHYLLLVRWGSVADHEEGFRKSPRYQQWKKLLHHFYDPFPTVLHYEPVARWPGQASHVPQRLYMIIERFKDRDAAPVYQRFRERGRMAPEGLTYVSSWVDEALSTCYQVMETADPALLEEWMANWKDLVDFEVHRVMTSKEAAEKIGA